MKAEVIVRIRLEAADLGGIGAALDEFLPEGRLAAGTYEFRLDRRSRQLHDLVARLEELGLDWSMSEERSFRPREIMGAVALHVRPTVTLGPGPSADGGVFEGGCPACRSGGEQVGELVIDPPPRRRMGFIWSAEGELLVDEQVARRMIAEAITGCILRGTRDGSGRLHDLFQVLPTSTLPPLQTPPTRLEEDPSGICPVCGQGGLRVGSMLYYDVPEEGIFDLNVTAERFVSERGQCRSLVVSQRLFRLLCACHVRTLEVEPVMLV